MPFCIPTCKKMISVHNLRKTYLRHKKAPGLKGLIKDLISRRYERVEALRGVSFEISPGEFVGYIGPNGAGKTTTMKILSGILYPTDGEVNVLGFIPWERKKEYLRKITFVMGQKNQLWWDLPAYDSFKLLKEIYDIPEAQFEKNLHELTELLGVEYLINYPVRRLSLGERMKMELVASLLHEPEVIFLDEPTIGLDIVSQEKIREFLKIYNREKKATIILTSHYIRDIESVCERIILLHKGYILFDGNKNELIEKFRKYRVINILFKKKIPENLGRYGEVISVDELKVKIKANSGKVREVIKEISSKFEILAMEIEEVSMEDIIKETFEELLSEQT
ncbi:MAG: hypothetical protein B5M53_07360 [Candidatus Cloacimonas sp. 4484_209]|nr:MAG: hypothetical protein B5M53_07360 [Candidatus Cloacimonas sp. 4484_209]RKX38812.1 MAG: hypothetical protein DRP23_06010 [Thermotogota bacterium]